jgi:5-methylcytosine-specific restriction endonuclease McrA
MLSDHLCECGCGEFTTLIQRSELRVGRVRGEPNRFIVGHNGRRSDEHKRAVRNAGRRAAYAKDLEVSRAKARAWQAVRDGDALAAYARAWREANRDHVREEKRLRELSRRGRRRDQFVEHVSPLMVLERDDGVCGICGDDVDPQNFHVDHITPLFEGGLHAYSNVRAAHPSCNLRRKRV